MYYVIWVDNDYDVVDMPGEDDIVLYGPANYGMCRIFILSGGKVVE